MMPKGGVGAELGVFTGLFSEQIVKLAKPRRLYLVDPWWVQYGELFPDWGPYSDHGKLPTKVAYDAALARTAQANTEVIPVVQSSIEWLATIPDHHLDWAYLDSSHDYPGTWHELHALVPKIKPDGFIFGDDWQLSPDHMHAGVMLAVNDFVRATDFDLRSAGTAAQWLIMRRQYRHRKETMLAVNSDRRGV